MRILFVCHRLPYPPNRGGKIRPFNMIRHLSRQHSVTVASLAHTEEELAQGAALKEYCAEVIAEIVPDRTRWWQAVKALPTSMPSSVAYFGSKRLYTQIKAKLESANFDLIFVHCAFVAQDRLNNGRAVIGRHQHGIARLYVQCAQAMVDRVPGPEQIMSSAAAHWCIKMLSP